MKVPLKWIYPLPLQTPPPLIAGQSQEHRKTFILVVEEMKVPGYWGAVERWRKQFTKRHVDELVTVMKETGYNDTHPTNIPMNDDGQIVFLDTELCGSTLHKALKNLREDVPRRAKRRIDHHLKSL